MTIIMRTTMAGPNGVFPAGKPANLSEQDERRLVDGGYATYEKPPVRGESATAGAYETASLPAARRGRK